MRAYAIRAETLALLVSPACPDGGYAARCGLVVDQLRRPIEIQAFIEGVCGEVASDGPSERCQARWGEMYVARLAERYSHAEFQAVVARCQAYPVECSDTRVVELRVLGSHNANAVQLMEQETSRLQLEYGQERERLNQEMAAGVTAGMNAVNGQLDSYNRRKLEVLEQLNVPRVVVAKECFNDFGCGYGSHCLKDQTQLSGYCAEVVNEMGVRDFAPPRPGTVVGGDCSFDSDCPVMFQCVKSAGQLKGFCLKR